MVDGLIQITLNLGIWAPIHYLDDYSLIGYLDIQKYLVIMSYSLYPQKQKAGPTILINTVPTILS